MGWDGTHLKILIGNYKVKGQDLITQMESSTPIIISYPMICAPPLCLSHYLHKHLRLKINFKFFFSLGDIYNVNTN